MGGEHLSKELDDFEATRLVVETLSKFDSADQKRIVRWACEKLGIDVFGSTTIKSEPIESADKPTPPPIESRRGVADIKSFVAEKAPATDMQFATTIAYYYAFEAPEVDRKSSITADDLQTACRLLGRARFQNPAQTLINTCYNGLLDKAEERGAYRINTVGENLVAVSLPSGNSEAPKKNLSRKKAPSKSASKKKKKKKATKPRRKK